MSNFLGGNEVSGMYLGSNEISEMYLGSNLIYSSSHWPHKTLRISKDGGITWEDHGRPTSVTAKQFFRMGITHVELPNSIKNIGQDAFYGNRLTSVVFPESLTNIEHYAFQNNQLTSVVFPESLTSIGEYAFRSNRTLAQVRISKNTSYVGSGPTASFDTHTIITTY